MALQQHILKQYGLKLYVGAELEFYLIGDNVPYILEGLQKNGVILETERGYWQYEMVFQHTNNLGELCDEIITKRTEVAFYAKQYGGKALFGAKPYAEDYGSGLHFHLTLHHPESTHNVFQAQTVEDEVYAEYLLQRVISGLLDISDEAVYVLCKQSQDYRRFEPHFDGPTHVAWGGNNRTVLLRIPGDGARRIEFRLPPSSCNIAAAIFVLCIGVVHGLVHDLPMHPRIYGNAFDSQYNLKSLPKNSKEAYNAFAKGKKILYHVQTLLMNKDDSKSKFSIEKILWKSML